MSIERFFESHPPGREMAQDLAVQMENLGVKDPIVIYFASQLAIAGAEGVKEKNKDIEDMKEFEVTPQWCWRAYDESMNESTPAVYGNLVIGLGETLEDGLFSLENFVSRMEHSMSGTLIKDMYRPTYKSGDLDDSYNRIEVLDDSKLEEMRQAHEEDPTFSVFFENPSLLPNSMIKYLEQLGIIGHLKNFARRWKERATYLIETVDSEDAHHEAQSDKPQFSPKELIILEDLRKRYESGDI